MPNMKPMKSNIDRSIRKIL